MKISFKISFNVNLKRMVVLLTAVAVGWYLWASVIQQAEAPFVPLLVFGVFCVYLGSLLSGWLIERGLLYHFRSQGFNEETCRRSTEEIEESLSRMPATSLFD